MFLGLRILFASQVSTWWRISRDVNAPPGGEVINERATAGWLVSLHLWEAFP
jgi:hypothetical protein